VILFAVTDPQAGSRGITAFLIDTTRAGFSRGKSEPKMGVRASATCEIRFDDYLAEAADVIGVPGQGFKLA
jgi:Acyl-CoA dehydrogenases